MNWQASLSLRKKSLFLIVLSTSVLLVCLFFTFYSASRNLDSGITLTVELEVIDLPDCSADVSACEFNRDKLQIGDRLIKIGEYTNEQFWSDRRLAPLGEYEPGDVIPITFERNGEEFTIEWEMFHPNFLARLFPLIIPLFFFGPFWLVGTLFLFYLEPHDSRWRVQVLFYYLTALWLAVGLQSVTRYAYSSLILHAIGWLLVPIFLNFHIIIPTPILPWTRNRILPPLYVISVMFALLELTQTLPTSSYLVGLIIAFISSITILAFRSFSATQSAERLSARIMFAGVILALGPGMLLWIMPTLLGTETPGEIATALALLAIPLLPLFYGYAVYKRRLGANERRVNLFLAKYTLFISYLIIFAFATLVAGRQPGFSSRTVIYGLIFLLAFLLAALPLHDFVEKVLSRLAYGRYYRQDELVNRFSGLIPAVSNQQELVRLIVEDLCPSLWISQSAMLSIVDAQVETIYENGIVIDSSNFSQDDFEQILQISSIYINYGNLPDELLQKGYEWFRLAIPLNGRSQIIGLWLFGGREPDDFYSQTDIETLEILARQLAITVENGQLFTAVQKQLLVRREAEERALYYANRLSLLHNLDQAMLRVETPGDIAQVALSGLAEIVCCTWASVTYFDSEFPGLMVNATLDARPGFAKSELPEMQLERILARSSSGNEPWIIENVAELDPETPLFRYLQTEGLVTFLSAPLRFGDKLLGSLNFAYDQPTEINSEHKEIARQVTSSLVLAIQSARLRNTITQHSHDLKQLSARLIIAQETERKRISYELHDEIGQILTTIIFDLVGIEREVKILGSSSVMKKLNGAKELVEQLMGQVRSMSLELHPSMLQDLGLVPTLRWYINTYADRRDIDVRFKVLEFSGQSDEETEIALYRIFQEALTNVSRHARARKITLCLEKNSEMITASIEDDGIGFDVQEVLLNGSPDRGVGLLAMRERVASLNGRFDLRSDPGIGTRIGVEIPIEKKEIP